MSNLTPLEQKLIIELSVLRQENNMLQAERKKFFEQKLALEELLVQNGISKQAPWAPRPIKTQQRRPSGSIMVVRQCPDAPRIRKFKSRLHQ